MQILTKNIQRFIFLLLFSMTSCVTTGNYDGAYMNGKYHGFGTLTFESGEKYIGRFKYGKRDGFGTNYFPSGEKYVGYWKNGKRNGEGTNSWRGGDKYEGNFKDDKRYGKGIFTFKSGKVQEGMWKNDKYQYYVNVKEDSKKKKISNFSLKAFTDNYLCSKATETKNGKKRWVYSGTTFVVSQYETEAKRRGLKCGIVENLTSVAGKGIGVKNIQESTTSLKKYYAKNLLNIFPSEKNHSKKINKNNYIKLTNLSECPYHKSGYKNNCYGKIITKKYKYFGEFKNNMKHGKGKYEHIANDKFNGYTYVGQYYKDKRHGYGVAKWQNGDKFAGEYLNGIPNGFGIYTYSNGDAYEGNFKNNKREGEGRYLYKNGKVQEGIWKNNKFIYVKKINKKKKQLVEERKPKISYDDLYASRQEAERERKKRIEVERKLALFLEKQKKERDKIDTDIRVPILEIISNKTKGKRGTIRGIAKDNVGIAEVTIDGKPVNISSNGNFEYSTYVPSRGVELKVEVTDVAGLTTFKVVSLKGNFKLARANMFFDRLNPLNKKVKPNPNALALIVGVSKYENTKAKALYADNDAMVFKDYATMKLGIPPSNINELINDRADRIDITRAIKTWLLKRTVTNKTDIYIFFAGHGLARDDGKGMYLLPYDGVPDLLEDSAILRKELFADIQATKPRSATIFLDTCYSGGTRNDDTLVANLRPIILTVKQQAVPSNFTVLSAAQGNQTSQSLEEVKHGLFSYYIMLGMEGGADTNNDNKITARELHSFVLEKVERQSQFRQTPELQGDKDRVLVQFQ